jgi:hypothetical protein
VNPTLLSAWMAELVLITYRDAKKGALQQAPLKGAPVPAEYASTFIIFGVLGFATGDWARPAGLFGWGLVLATFLNLWNPGSTGKGIQTPAGTLNTPSNPYTAGGLSSRPASSNR